MTMPSIHDLIYKMEVGSGTRWLRRLMLVLLVLGLVFVYDLRAYHGFTAPDAMDAAQVARNLAEGRGFTTDFIRPFSLYLVQAHNLDSRSQPTMATNLADAAEINGPHPDLTNPPLYPLLLAGLMTVWPPAWPVELHRPFWSNGGRFVRYQPEFRIAMLNQLLLIAAVWLTFLLARKLFDGRVAWIAALLTLGSDQLWQFSMSGLSTLLLLVILLGLVLCLVKAEELARAEVSKMGRLAAFAIGAGVLAGLGMLTRYSFGALIAPVVVFLVLFGGAHRGRLVFAAVAGFALVISPWLVRNLMISGTLFGAAGYEFIQAAFFPGTELMQSVHPNLTTATGIMPYVHKFLANINAILPDGLGQLGGGWLGILFFAGLLLGIRSVAARRLRYFTLMSLAALTIIQSLGQSSPAGSVVNSENLLVLLAPLAAIFGTVFFLTLLDQMKLPDIMVHYGIIALLFVLACQPLTANVLARNNPVSYPPYYPPEIQQVSGWLKPNELMMSDVPWAVAWYGRHQCVWLTRNANDSFYAINDYLKPISGIYFTTVTMDEKFLSEMARGEKNSWGQLILNAGMHDKFPKGFPLRTQKVMATGLFLTDRPRWPDQ